MKVLSITKGEGGSCCLRDLPDCIQGVGLNNVVHVEIFKCPPS